jgi:hypothetical protein
MSTEKSNDTIWDFFKLHHLLTFHVQGYKVAHFSFFGGGGSGNRLPGCPLMSALIVSSFAS